jgi:hypothetical protein
MRAIQQIGPRATNAQLSDSGGIERRYSIHTVKGRLSYLCHGGFVNRIGKGSHRQLYVTALGQALLDDPEACEDALVDSKTISKPEAIRTYERKVRHCLSCRREFTSDWPGNRVCGDCRRTVTWQEGVELTEYPVIGGR